MECSSLGELIMSPVPWCCVVPTKSSYRPPLGLTQAAFHGSADAAKVLLDKKTFDGIALGLHTVLDKEGKTPLTHAKDEGNNDVAKVIEEAESNASGDSAGVDEGLRKRK